jgi:hypothetical protein
MKKRSATNAGVGKSSPSKKGSLKSKRSAKRTSRSTASTFPNEWSEFIGLLCSHRVRFLIVGAHALGVLGRVRATKDLDLWIEPTRANAKRVTAALADYGFTGLADAEDAFAERDRMATLGREPLRIDLMTSISGVDFSSAWRTRVQATLGGYRVAVLGRSSFIQNKTASARPQDLLDVALLRESEASVRATTK